MTFARTLGVVLSLTGLTTLASAQTTVTTTTTQVDAVVEAHVTTTTTTVTSAEPLLTPNAEPVVTVGPPAPTAVTEASDIVGFVLPRLEILALDPTYDMAALGGSVLVGADVGGGWSGGLLLGYFGDIGFEGEVSELDVGLEASRDLSPDDTLGFLLITRVVAAVPLGERDAGQAPVHLVGQLGIGARITLGPRLAIVTDIRAYVRIRPDASVVVHGGLDTTMGLRVNLD